MACLDRDPAAPHTVMRGLVPRIQRGDGLSRLFGYVVGRDKPGHDVVG
jgi:hypothetical protein